MDRTQLLFKTLVECYIRDGQPVGSKALVREAELCLSSATVRNILAALEDKGLLASPHASAGRVPTQQGYRLFVDRLLTVEPLAVDAVARLHADLSAELSPRELIARASQFLSEITLHTGLVMVPRRDLVEIRQIEFLSLGGLRVLVILVFGNNDVQNQIIHTARLYAPEELTQAGNYLTHRFAGKSLGTIAEELIRDMQADKADMDSLMQAALDIAARTFDASPNGDYVLSGEANLLGIAESQGVARLQELFAAFNAKRDILHLLEGCQRSDGVELYIGAESGLDPFEDLTVVTAPYEANGRVLGRLAVIGPTRMAYQRVIPLVEVTAKILSSALNTSA
jgi:heat-inducible transcriptional repressor